jgi:slime mold repeat-containing protein
MPLSFPPSARITPASVALLAGGCLLVLTAAWSAGLDPGREAKPAPAVSCPPCDDGDPCTVDRCDTTTGECVHPPVNCDDLEPCTQDTCVSAAGGCQFNPIQNGTACDDQNPCTQADACQAGKCAGAPLACDDQNACTYDQCENGTCAHYPVDCNDNNSCTTEACNPATGTCSYTSRPDGAACNDGNTCTVADHCLVQGQQSFCTGTPTPGAACDDGSPCTTGDVCGGGGPMGGASCGGQFVSCNDGDPCTSDSCDKVTGQCSHRPPNCDDGNPCTNDSCHPTTGQCLHAQVPGGTTCDDDSVCTGNDACANGPNGYRCYGTPLTGQACDDNNPCSVADRCQSDGRGGAYCNGDPLECSDGNACTYDQCDYPAGTCRSWPYPCDDGNPCSTDTCSQAAGGCQYTYAEEGSVCNDFNPCTVADVCQGGYCSGAPVDCDDGNLCTADYCDYGTGACVHQTTDCNDVNACTDDSCNPATGQCQNVPRPNGASCDDQSACTQDEACTDGQCTGVATTCNDGDPCTTDVCDPSTGQCVFVPVSCVDSNPCTADSCDPETGQCRHTPLPPGAQCDDNNLCTHDDFCNIFGSCSGIQVVCNDNNTCTNEFCNSGSGTCQYFPISGPCDDGNACTTFDFCNNGQCTGSAVPCNDGDPCTADSCDPATGQCTFTPVTCSDGNDCTVDSCDRFTGQCHHSPVPDENTPCNDGNECTQGTVCQAGVCVGGFPIFCFDNNTCTTDTCDPALGCLYPPVADGVQCDDFDQCTAQDRCLNGGCQGTPTNCDDLNSCTLDSCNQFSGQCEHAPFADGIPCDDRSLCTAGEQCSNGQCVGTPSPCSDNDACTQDSCDPATGECRFIPIVCLDNEQCTVDFCDPAIGCRHDPVPNGSGCSDGSLCSVGMSCQYGQCTGERRICDDGNPCTTDSCSEQTGACRFDPKCFDKNPCTLDVCDPQTGACQFPPVPVGTTCDDQNPCSANDACINPGMGGLQCRGTATPGVACDDGNLCTMGDTCSSTMPGGPSFCQGTEIGCSDGNVCTFDYCQNPGGQCGHEPVICDDQNPCTVDSCGPGNGQCSSAPVPEGTSCNDAAGCIVNGHCGNGQAGFACYGTPNIGAACNDSNGCTDQDLCRNDGRGGAFCAGTQVTCDDGNGCTYEYCQGPFLECQQVAASCNDGNSCTLDLCDPAGPACDSSQPAPFYEVWSLKFVGETLFEWSPTPGASHWNSYRGTIPANMLGSRLPGSVYDHVCFESADSLTNGALSSIDAATPPLGTGYYYDATEERSCGEGPLGTDSAGVVRPNLAPCPTPP